MKQVYDILGAVERHFKYNEEFINTVTFGDIRDVDLNKATIFPLAHFFVDNIEFAGSTMNFTLSLMCLDIVDENKEYDNSFEKAVNFQDVLNTQATVINKLVESFRGNRGYLAEQQFVLENNPTAELLQDKFENRVAGWGIDISVSVPNDISIC